MKKEYENVLEMRFVQSRMEKFLSLEIRWQDTESELSETFSPMDSNFKIEGDISTGIITVEIEHPKSVRRGAKRSWKP